MNAHLIDWAAIPSVGEPDGVRRRRLAGVGAELVLVEVPAGTTADRHSHAHEQFVQVISGSGALETAAGRGAFKEGSVFHFPPGAWHAAEFLTDTVLVETNLHAAEPR
jgi:quercetin dioxygenase-like cupin family protein